MDIALPCFIACQRLKTKASSEIRADGIAVVDELKIVLKNGQDLPVFSNDIKNYSSSLYCA